MAKRDFNVDIDLNNNDLLNVDSVALNTSTSDTPGIGKLVWDDGEGTAAIGLKGGNVNLQLGQEMVVRVYNGTGSTITDGKVVYISGAQGQRPSISLADADTEATSSKVLGITTESIANEAEGFVATFGVVNGLNTSAFTAGQALWLSSTAGEITGTKPVAPAHTVFVGYAISINASSGRIFVSPQNGYELNEIHDVLIDGTPADNEVLAWDSASSLWKNQTAAEAGLATSGHNHTLDSLSNVTITSNSSGELLKWNGTAWVNNTLAEAGIQPLDSDLTAIAGLASTAGFLKKVTDGTWSIDISSYVAGVGTSKISYQTTAPSSPTTGDIWIDSDAVANTFSEHLNKIYTPTSGSYLHSGAAVSTSWLTGTGFMKSRKIFVPETLTFDEITCSVTGAGSTGAVVRLGIYSCKEDGTPDALILDAGTVSTTVTGPRAISISQTLSPGVYWLVAVGQGVQSTLRADNGTGHWYYQSSFATADMDCFEQSGVTGALPSTFTGTSMRSGAPRIMLRVA